MIIIITDGFEIHYAKNENERFISSTERGGCYVEYFIEAVLTKDKDYIEYLVPNSLLITAPEDSIEVRDYSTGKIKILTTYETPPSFANKTLSEIKAYLKRNGYELERI